MEYGSDKRGRGRPAMAAADDRDEAVESIYADRLADMGRHAVWNGDLYAWSENHYAQVPDSDAEAEAFAWLRAFPKKRTAGVAASAVSSAKLAVPKITGRMLDGFPETSDEYRCVIPTQGMWLEVVFRKDENGRTHSPAVFYKTPEPNLARAVMSSVPIRMEGADGAPYVPAPIPSTSLFGRFLASAFPCEREDGILPEAAIEAAESVMSVQEYAGYSMLVGRSDQKAHLWMGDGANGKGVMSSLIQRFHRSIAVDLSNLDGFALSGIQDATLAVVDETPKDGFNEGRFKSLVGEGLTHIDRKYKDAVSVSCKAKWIINSNQEFGIRCRNSTGGFWRRFIFVEWKHVIPESRRREGLDRAIFEKEGRSVLDWMLAGLLRYLGRGGRLFESDASTRVKRSAIANSDIVGGWVADLGGISAMITPARTKSSTKDSVYEAFSDYCRNNGRVPVNSQEFWTRLKKTFGNALTDTQAKDATGKMARWVNLDVAREGAGHLTAPQGRGDSEIPDFDGPAPVLSGATLLEELYGLAPGRLSEDSAARAASCPAKAPTSPAKPEGSFKPSHAPAPARHAAPARAEAPAPARTAPPPKPKATAVVPKASVVFPKMRREDAAFLDALPVVADPEDLKVMSEWLSEKAKEDWMRDLEEMTAGGSK